MNKVKEILFNFPDATEVTLEDCHLSSLEEVMPDLIKLKNLKILRLGQNKLTKLPSDMSGLARLEFLDLTQNEFSDLGSIMSGLFSLPSLKHLYINLSESDEDEIIVSLTNLESFNGTPLTDIPDTDFPNTIPTGGEPVAREVAQTGKNSIQISSSNDRLDLNHLRDLFLVVNQEPNSTKTEEELSNTWIELSSNIGVTAPESMEKQRVVISKMLTGFLEKLSESHPYISSVVSSAFFSYDTLLSQYYKFSSIVTKDLERSDQEIGQLLEAAEILEKETLENEAAKNKLAEQFEVEKEKFIEEVGYLRTELEKHKNRLRQFQLNRQKISTQINTSPKHLLNSSKNVSGNESSISSKPAPKISKVLSLKQIREIIDEIYASKSKFDQKCVDNQLPRETMEQHLYTYLNQKYGLKNLILEWASAITQGVKKYTPDDNSVAVFGKILRNEIDEEFRFVQRQLCDTVAELLRVYVKGKYPKKVDSEIIAILQKKMGAIGVLNEEEWVDIIKYMYNKEDSVNVIVKVQDAINKLNLRRQKNKKELLRDNKIPYNEFLKVLLDFQLKGHERFLSKFVKLFKQFDNDKNGVINEAEFRKLLLTMNPERTENDIDYWLNHIDPWNNQQITFSECVTFLSADLVRMMQEGKKEEEETGTSEEEEEEEGSEYETEEESFDEDRSDEDQ